MELINCPEPNCGLPAEITDRRDMESTDGPVTHVKIACVMRHWFFMPEDMLPKQEEAT